MSASREKKQRQGAGLSEKALQAQQQQAARKRKTVIYTVVGVVIAVLVAALLIWRTGFFQARATAATVGGKNISVAELSYYYYSAHYKYWELYYAYGLAASIPADTAVMNQETGRTYRDYFLEAALSAAQEDLALADEARRNGHTEAEVRDTLNARIKSLKTDAASSGYGSYSAYLKAMYGPYMSAGVFEKVYTQYLLANLVYNGKGAELMDSYTEADLKAYYEADDHADTLDTFEYSYLYFTPAAVEDEDEDGNELDEDAIAELEEAALAEAKANAEAALEALRDGGSISSLADEYELADGAYSDHATSVGVTSAPSAIRETLLSMKDGDVELVENGESGYYVAVLHSRRLVEDLTRDVRHILIRAETTTEDGKVVAPTDEAWATAKAEIDAILAEYEAGARTEDSFAALANEKSDDGNGTTGGLYEGAYDGYFIAEFNDWVFGAGHQSGDVSEPIRHEGDPEKSNQYWGYHLIYYVGENEPIWKLAARNALAAEDLDAWEDELMGNYQAALTDGADNIGQ